MPKRRDVEELDALHGEKMIEVKVRFWTNNIASSGRVKPKHAWSGGVVRMERNATHGITPGKPIPFNSLLEVATAIEKALIAHGVRIHPSKRMRKYVATSDEE
jgi:hypothetical protein